MKYELTKKKFIDLLILLLLFWISNVTYAENIVSENTNQNIFNETLQISGIVGVFLGPNETEVMKMNKEDNEGLAEYVDDSQYYQKLAWDFLGKENIKTVFTTERYLEFIKNNGEKITIDREKIQLKDWGIYIFDGIQDPLKIDFLGDIEFNNYIKYFNLKIENQNINNKISPIENKPKETKPSNKRISYIFLGVIVGIVGILMVIKRKE